MKEDSEKTKNEPPKGKDRPHTDQSHEEIYLYQNSGIQERHGTVPLWLKLVSIGLLAWAVYYTIQYWSRS
jgi:hypothetical protein